MKDPYLELFNEYANGKGHIDSVRKWESYHDKMCALGLIEESLANTSREMGLENSSRRKPFKIDFAKFQSNLQKLNTSPELEKYQESLQCIFSQTKGLLERAHEWDMENMSYQQIRNHLMDVCEIRGMHKGAVGEIQAQVEFHKFVLSHHDVYILFWDKLLDERDKSSSASPGTSGMAYEFQMNKMSELDKKFSYHHTKQVQLMKTGKRVDRSTDNFGHCKGIEFGVITLKGRSSSKAATSGVDVQVVAMSKRIPPYQWTQIYNHVDAHQQLLLSPYFQRYTGDDMEMSDTDIFFYFESIVVTSLESIIQKVGCIHESSCLFRCWTVQVLQALMDLQHQCTHFIHEKVNLENVLVSTKGTDVYLGKILFGDPINEFNEEFESAYLDREVLLVEAFSRILHRLVCPTTIPQNEIDFDRDYIAGYDCTLKYSVPITGKNLDVVLGDTFELVLDGEIKEFSVDSAHVERTDSKKTIQFKAKSTGQCSVFLHYDDAPEAIEVLITIHVDRITPTLRAILKCCAPKRIVIIHDDGKPRDVCIRTPTLQQIAHHPLFEKSKSANEGAASEFDQCMWAKIQNSS